MEKVATPQALTTPMVACALTVSSDQGNAFVAASEPEPYVLSAKHIHASVEPEYFTETRSVIDILWNHSTINNLLIFM
jgi:hypothetical protein